MPFSRVLHSLTEKTAVPYQWPSFCFCLRCMRSQFQRINPFVSENVFFYLLFSVLIAFMKGLGCADAQLEIPNVRVNCMPIIDTVRNLSVVDGVLLIMDPTVRLTTTTITTTNIANHISSSSEVLLSRDGLLYRLARLYCTFRQNESHAMFSYSH